MLCCLRSSDRNFAAKTGEIMENREFWKGLRYIPVVRQSNDDKGKDSVDAQLNYLCMECDADGMIYIDKIVLQGVTGSLPARREHYTKLKERKLKHDDFDVVVIQRIDRAT